MLGVFGRRFTLHVWSGRVCGIVRREEVTEKENEGSYLPKAMGLEISCGCSSSSSWTWSSGRRRWGRESPCGRGRHPPAGYARALRAGQAGRGRRLAAEDEAWQLPPPATARGPGGGGVRVRRQHPSGNKKSFLLLRLLQVAKPHLSPCAALQHPGLSR